MRKSILAILVLVILTATSAFAQIAVTNTFQPSPGTVLHAKFDASMNATFYNTLSAGTGGPMLWDFSSRVYGTDYLTYVVATAPAPGVDSFPQANLTLMSPVTTTDTSWAFERSVSGSFTQLGSFGRIPTDSAYVVYHNTTPNWVFPFTYNSQWTEHHTSTRINTNNYSNMFDTTFYLCDAWGTAKYSGNSVPCLRVTAHFRQTTRTYNNGGTLLDTLVFEMFTVNFIAAGFNSIATADRTPNGTTDSYSGTASSDFVNQHTGVTEDRTGGLPRTFSIDQNYPNPFNPNTEIRFSVPARSNVRLSIFNVEGQEIKTLIDQQLSAGTFVANWDGTNEAGSHVASGVYLYRLNAGSFTESKKMVLLK